MEHVNLGLVIEQSISKFGQNRIGNKPPVFVMISPALTPIPWHDRSLKEFVRMFLYEVLLTNDPDAIIEVALRQKITLKDLNAFVGVRPSCWIQLRVAGRGLKVMENLIEELFAETGYPLRRMGRRSGFAGSPWDFWQQEWARSENGFLRRAKP